MVLLPVILGMYMSLSLRTPSGKKVMLVIATFSAFSAYDAVFEWSMIL